MNRHCTARSAAGRSSWTRNRGSRTGRRFPSLWKRFLKPHRRQAPMLWSPSGERLEPGQTIPKAWIASSNGIASNARLALRNVQKVQLLLSTASKTELAPGQLASDYWGECFVATVKIEEAQAHLPQIIAGLNPGEALTITQNGEPVATLERSRPKQWPCKAGSAKDTNHWMAPDFDAPLEDFRE